MNNKLLLKFLTLFVNDAISSELLLLPYNMFSMEADNMAIYGIGAFYGGKDNYVKDFINEGVACIGWKEEDAPPIFSIMKHMKIGDIVYIKTHPPNIGLSVKAIGIVTNDKISPKSQKLKKGIDVQWIWKGDELIGKVGDGCDAVRNNTLYEEYNPTIQRKIVSLLSSCFRED